MQFVKKSLLWFFALAVAGCFVLLLCWLGRNTLLPLFVDNPKAYVDAYFASGGTLTDRQGEVLRHFSDERGDFSHRLKLSGFSPYILQAVLIAEDRAFYRHSGFNLKAILRAMWQNFSNRRIVSGASTISQQVIRIIRPAPRSYSTKISELLLALRLELEYSKEEILEIYLNSVPMFGNIRGIGLASQLLFNKGAQHLNLAEAATLAAILQAPTRLSPFSNKGNKLLTSRRNWILKEMLSQKICSYEEYANALELHIPTWRRKQPLRAPHFCEMCVSEHFKPVGTVKTTIDLNLQSFLVETLTSHIPRLLKLDAKQVCAIIADTQTLGVLALAGSAQYGPIAGGYNNGVTARRSGGSILKPFLYSLAFERGYHPSFVIADTMQAYKTEHGDYLPYNADRNLYGPVTIRNALGNSLNVAAVKMLNSLGVRDFYSFLASMQILNFDEGRLQHLGLGLAIGNPEVRLVDLVRAYACLARGGKLANIKFFTEQEDSETSVISPETAWLIFDILSDSKARLLTFGNPSFYKYSYPVAIKTGTSTNYRDGWLLGVTPDFVIGIWAGNFSGAATAGLTGTAGCGPILKDIMNRLETIKRPSIYPKPDNIKQVKVCSISGQIPGDYCPSVGYDYVNPQTMLIGACEFHKESHKESHISHEVRPEYAIWLQQRQAHLDNDVFRLENEVPILDYYSPQGLETIEAKPLLATAPLRIPPMGFDSSFEHISIVSPHDGDRFVISAGIESFAKLRAIPEFAVSEIIWLINGKEYIRTPPPYEAYWPLRRGTHRITALSGGQVGAEITIEVD